MTNPMTMGRIEIINELRGLTDKRELDFLLGESTAMIRARLVWLRSSLEERTDRRARPMPKPKMLGIEMTAIIFDEVEHPHRRCSDKLKAWLTRA